MKDSREFCSCPFIYFYRYLFFILCLFNMEQNDNALNENNLNTNTHQKLIQSYEQEVDLLRSAAVRRLFGLPFEFILQIYKFVFF